jgi:CBS domain-containing protein
MSGLLERDLIESNMSTNVETVEPTVSLKHALRRIVALNIGSIVVVKGDEPVGIITERDISRYVAADEDALKRKVKYVMSKPLITVEPTASIQEAVELMVKHGVRRLPVMKQQKLVGIISQRDVLRWVLRVGYEPHIPPEVKEILAHPVKSKREQSPVITKPR